MGIVANEQLQQFLLRGLAQTVHELGRHAETDKQRRVLISQRPQALGWGGPEGLHKPFFDGLSGGEALRQTRGSAAVNRVTFGSAIGIVVMACVADDPRVAKIVAREKDAQIVGGGNRPPAVAWKLVQPQAGMLGVPKKTVDGGEHALAIGWRMADERLDELARRDEPAVVAAEYGRLGHGPSLRVVAWGPGGGTIRRPRRRALGEAVARAGGMSEVAGGRGRGRAVGGPRPVGRGWVGSAAVGDGRARRCRGTVPPIPGGPCTGAG